MVHDFPKWVIEQLVYVGHDTGPARIVHRGHCASCRASAITATTDQARAALRYPDAAPCPICRPDRPLRAT
ncbi:DUF6233 domain-containing protein [Actinacidiphila oryziradicis]|uniref:DUF6233 domain-containing protein n=1 Tax=Actinacidiphila oryziradicis TaxID=2571141 RepID=UPI0038992EB9